MTRRAGAPMAVLAMGVTAVGQAADWGYIQVDDARAKWGDFDGPEGLRYFGIGAADMDGDGDLDVVSGRYVYRNPGGDMKAWERVDVGGNVDGMVAVDVDGDAHADVIAQALPEVLWMEAEDAGLGTWRRTVIGELPKTGHTNGQGYGAGDVDGDGDVDLVTGEHKGPHLRVQVFENDGRGTFTQREIDRGKECHLGMRLFDLDADGDLDIVGPAWDDYRFLHLWRNEGP